MSQPKTCCPTGYIYDTSTGTCMTINHMPGPNPIECPCCPVGYQYNSMLGLCINVSGDTTSSIQCPCCPAGFFYVSVATLIYPSGYCQNQLNAATTTAPIPCITISCVPASPRTCEPCETNLPPNTQPTHVPVNFTFDFTQKNCTVCVAHGYQVPKNGSATFLPTNYIDPDIIFKLRNKNLI